MRERIFNEIIKSNKTSKPEVGKPLSLVLNSVRIELQRAGHSTLEAKAIEREDWVLELGKSQEIRPCSSCPKRMNSVVLCEDSRGGLPLSDNGVLLCPDGKGAITLNSVGK